MGLFTEPYSRFRNAYWHDHPPIPSKGDGVPSWIGWSPSMNPAIAFMNFMITRFGRRVRKEHLFKTPLDVRRVEIASSAAAFLKLLDARGIPYSNG